MVNKKSEDGGSTAVIPDVLAAGVEVPVTVRATQDGIYPDHEGIHRRRLAGEVFTVKRREHVSKMWMREVRDGEEVPAQAVREIPQTTARMTRRADPFPPMQ